MVEKLSPKREVLFGLMMVNRMELVENLKVKMHKMPKRHDHEMMEFNIATK